MTASTAVRVPGDETGTRPDPHPVPRLADPARKLRPATLELCHRVRTAERAHFDAYCAVSDRRKKALPGALLALERRQHAELHDAVEALRAHCAKNPQAAEAERVALMGMQVEGDLALAAQLRVVRDGEQRQGLRVETNERRATIFESRDALSCGLGWPHRSERVVVAAWIYDSTQPDGKFTYAGEALYLYSYDTHNVSHIVRVEGLAVNRGELTVCWEPHEPWGNAEPDGDIDMRVAADPQRRLPHPLPRWPTESDVGEIDFRVGIAVGEQLALL
jgi:hypothetical protein